MLMLFVSIVFLSACQPFVFANIPEDEIPDYIKESIKDLGSDDSKAKDIVWRVCEERENYTWVAAEYKLEVFGRTENMYAIAIYDSQGSSGEELQQACPMIQVLQEVFLLRLDILHVQYQPKVLLLTNGL